MAFSSSTDVEAKVSDDMATLLHSVDHAEVFAAAFPNNSDSLSSAFIASEAVSNAEQFTRQTEERLQRFLASEEEALKERIRLFTEQQEALFAVRKTRVETVMDVLCKLAQQVSSGEVIDRVHQTETHTKTERQESSEMQAVESQPVAREDVATLAADVDSWKVDDGLFDLDGFDSDGHGCEESDDEGSMADSGMELRRDSVDSHEQQRELATSIPISMPAFSRPRHEEMDMEDKLTEDFENIGASIKKLALSVQDTSDTLFGDLPRPRVNSDAAQRWH